jgi:HSP20 family protein
MLTRREKAPMATRDPFALLRRMTSEFDRLFDEPMFAGFRLPARMAELDEKIEWTPRIEVFEKDNRLVTRVDLPGMKKEDVKVEVADGQLAISGTRTRETEEKQDQFYRSEREYGSFYRAVPLPEGVGLDDVKATYNNGVLEVSIPMPAKPEEQKPRQVKIEDTTAPAGTRTAA